MVDGKRHFIKKKSSGDPNANMVNLKEEYFVSSRGGVL